MKTYAPYLLYQIARFGALKVPQMMQICEGKCSRSAIYRTLDVLCEGDYVYPLTCPASRIRAYYATKEGREFTFGDDHAVTTGVRTKELKHTGLCTDILLDLCRYENVTGISTHFEMSADEIRQFCHERIPDGIFRLTQEGRHYEMALEVESTVRNSTRVADVLARYWQTFKYGMPCTGLLVVAMDKTIYGMYTKAIQAMPPEFQSRVRLVLGMDLEGLPPEAYGQKTAAIQRCLQLSRTLSQEEITYTPVKSRILLSKSTVQNPHIEGSGQQQL